MSAKTYSVLIGDISKSRRQRNRAKLQEILGQVMVSANQLFKESLVSRLSITLGDEYQGVFRDPGSALRAAILIARDLQPVKLHHGIGIGPLSTAITPAFPGRMDGPAFHRARSAIHSSRRQKAWITLEGLAQADDEFLSASMALWGRIWESWTKRQREVIDMVEKMPDQASAAKRLGVQPPSVTNVLQAAKYQELNRLKLAALTFLNNRPGALSEVQVDGP